MTGIPFVDTHVHFHDFSYDRLRWDWLMPDDEPDPDIGEYSAIKAQRYVPDDFRSETRFHNVAAAIHVQHAIGTADPVEETRWLQMHAEADGMPQGIIAHADLGSPDAVTTLSRHAEFANLRGIRDLRYDGYLTDATWQHGFAALAKFNLVFCDDPLLEHMPLLAKLAERFPDITVCVDHAGFPRRRDSNYFREWRAGMSTLAAVENTVVKISGLGMCDHSWTTDSLRPWVLACIELWGPRRAFFGTNWPVDRLFSSYGDVVSAYTDLISSFTAAEQEELFSGSAEQVFRLA